MTVARYTTCGNAEANEPGWRRRRQLYTYGQSVSICFFTETWRPDSFYEKVAVNRREGLYVRTATRPTRLQPRASAHKVRYLPETDC